VSGLHPLLLKVERGLSLETIPLTPIQVCRITLEYISVLTTIPGLTPFWNSQSEFWTSSEITRTETLHYSYPEFDNLDMSDPDALKQAILSYVNHHYGLGELQASSFPPGIGLGPADPPGVNLLAQPAAGDAPPQVTHGASSASAKEVRNPSASQGRHPYTAEREEPGRGGPDVIHDWTARIRFKKYELRQSFAVLLFLGNVAENPSQWITAPTFVGSHTAFVNDAPEQCANCRSHLDGVSEGYVHLNSVISKRSGLSSYDPEVVLPYLKENLHWRIQGVRSCA
jgi:tyrosinase